jgi:hypothetical protein
MVTQAVMQPTGVTFKMRHDGDPILSQHTNTDWDRYAASAGSDHEGATTPLTSRVPG